MLIYIVCMAAIAVLFYKESKKLLEGRSTLLQEFCKDPLSTRTILSMLRIICLSALVSAVLMLAAFLFSKLTGRLPAPLAALSILCYTVGFISAMLKFKNL